MKGKPQNGQIHFETVEVSKPTIFTQNSTLPTNISFPYFYSFNIKQYTFIWLKVNKYVTYNRIVVAKGLDSKIC